MITTKVRNPNLELFRLLVMLSIVAHHCVVNSGLFDLMNEDPLGPKSIFLYLFGMWRNPGYSLELTLSIHMKCISSNRL